MEEVLLVECKKVHDELREKVCREMHRCNYSYPETMDFYVDGVCAQALDLGVLEALCEYAAAKGTSDFDGSWTGAKLFSLLKDQTANFAAGESFRISLCFGGLPPALVVLSYFFVYTQIQSLVATFARDKWEARGDYTAKSPVRIRFENGAFTVGNSRKTGARGSKKRAPKKTDGFKSDVISPAREQRSREYSVEKINAEEYLVTAKDKKHKVIERDGYFWCDCGDFLNEPKNCKHIIAVKRDFFSK